MANHWGAALFYVVMVVLVLWSLFGGGRWKDGLPGA